ncbi:hypothetical protein BST61_g1575 [Cercospora zeina]
MGLLINFATEVLKECTGVRQAADIWTVLPPSYRGFLLAWFHRALAYAYHRFKKSADELNQLADGISLQKPDDDIRLGYQLDVALMGKGKKSTCKHKTFGDVPPDSSRMSCTFKESDWKREEPEFM